MGVLGKEKLTTWKFAPVGPIFTQINFERPFIHQLTPHLPLRTRRPSQPIELRKHFQLRRCHDRDDGSPKTGVCAPTVVNV